MYCFYIKNICTFKSFKKIVKYINKKKYKYEERVALSLDMVI